MSGLIKGFDILVAGEINPDLILTDPHLNPTFGQQETLVEEIDLTIGSSSVIYACGAAKLGLRVAFVGVIGQDDFGKFMVKAIKENKIDETHIIVNHDIKTGLSVILNRGEDRAILTYSGAISALRAEQVTDEMLQQCRHLHVASYFLQNALRPGLANLFTRAKRLGLTISLDTNWDPTEKWEGLSDVLPLVDIFLPNENELLSLTKTEATDEALAILGKIVPIVVVKLGSRGAKVIAKSEKYEALSLIIDKIADSVGAGDTFDAGFSYGFLNGWSIQKTLKLASTCGALSLRKHGGTAAQPTLQEAINAMNADD